MGARGIGARPVRRPAKGEPSPTKRRRSWEYRGLTRAQRVIRFIEHLRITSGPHAGRRFKLRPWQQEIIRDWYKTDGNGRRVVRTAVLSMGRKQGKSSLAAALAIVHLVGPEREPRGQIIVGAADRDQSSIIFDEIVAMLEADEDLVELVTIRRHEKVIEELAGGSKFKALSSDAKKAHGLSGSVVILDELGVWGEGLGLRLYNALMTSSGARGEPLKIVISTQAATDTSKMSELLDYGEQLAEGVLPLNPAFWCRLYAVPDELDPFDETHWPLANPALGDFRSLEDMRELAERARRMPTERAAFENLYLNRRTACEERWIGRVEWEACQGEIDAEALVGAECWGGLDLGATRDLTSFALFFPASGALLSWSWCPAERIAERSERDRVPYDVWAKAGYIELTPGKATDKRKVALRLGELNALYQPRVVAYDKWGMSELERILADEGIELPLEEMRQGFASLSPASKAFEELVLNRHLVHDNPVLTWACSNVRIERDAADNIKPSKASSRERIDPLVAAVMAVGAHARQPPQISYDFSEAMVLTA